MAHAAVHVEHTWLSYSSQKALSYGRGFCMQHGPSHAPHSRVLVFLEFMLLILRSEFEMITLSRGRVHLLFLPIPLMCELMVACASEGRGDCGKGIGRVSINVGSLNETGMLKGLIQCIIQPMSIGSQLESKRSLELPLVKNRV